MKTPAKHCALAFIPLLGLCLRAQSPPEGRHEPAASSAQPSLFETVPDPPPLAVPNRSQPPIVAIEFRAARPLPESALRAIIASRAGAACDVATLRRDARTLYGTGRFSKVDWAIEQSRSGAVVHFAIVERPLIQSIEFEGGGAVTVPEMLQQFQRRKIRMRAETLYDERELAGAVAAVQELLAEKGRQPTAVTPLVEPAEVPSTVRIIFKAGDRR